MCSKCCKTSTFKDYLGHIRCSFCLLQCKTKFNWSLLFIIFLAMIFSGSSIKIHDEKFMKLGQIVKIEDNKDVELKDSCIIKELEKDSCPFIPIAISQIHCETGWYTSQIMKENKNLFGLRCYCKYAKGFKNGHSYYNSYSDCIKCYSDFSRNYWKAYCKNYAQSPDYLERLQKTK